MGGARDFEIRCTFKPLEDAELEAQFGAPVRFDENSTDISHITENAMNPESIPRGYPRYLPDTFEKYLGVSRRLSVFIANDYRWIISGNEGSYIAQIVREAGHTRNLKRLTERLEFRYGTGHRATCKIAGYFANLATARRDRERRLALGITEARWGYSAPCANPGHKESAHKLFKVSEGLKIGERFIYPDVCLDCCCMGESMIPGYDD